MRNALFPADASAMLIMPRPRHCASRIGITVLLGASLLFTACLETVTPSCVLSGVLVQVPTASLAVGQSTQASASFTAQNCSPTPSVVWSSDSTAVVTVNATGLITAVRAGGPVTVRATVSTQVGSTLVTVTP